MADTFKNRDGQTFTVSNPSTEAKNPHVCRLGADTIGYHYYVRESYDAAATTSVWRFHHFEPRKAV